MRIIAWLSALVFIHSGVAYELKNFNDKIPENIITDTIKNVVKGENERQYDETISNACLEFTLNGVMDVNANSDVIDKFLNAINLLKSTEYHPDLYAEVFSLTMSAGMLTQALQLQDPTISSGEIRHFFEAGKLLYSYIAQNPVGNLAYVLYRDQISRMLTELGDSGLTQLQKNSINNVFNYIVKNPIIFEKVTMPVLCLQKIRKPTISYIISKMLEIYDSQSSIYDFIKLDLQHNIKIALEQGDLMTETNLARFSEEQKILGPTTIKDPKQTSRLYGYGYGNNGILPGIPNFTSTPLTKPLTITEQRLYALKGMIRFLQLNPKARPTIGELAKIGLDIAKAALSNEYVKEPFQLSEQDIFMQLFLNHCFNQIIWLSQPGITDKQVQNIIAINNAIRAQFQKQKSDVKLRFTTVREKKEDNKEGKTLKLVDRVIAKRVIKIDNWGDGYCWCYSMLNQSEKDLKKKADVLFPGDYDKMRREPIQGQNNPLSQLIPATDNSEHYQHFVFSTEGVAIATVYPRTYTVNGKKVEVTPISMMQNRSDAVDENAFPELAKSITQRFSINPGGHLWAELELTDIFGLARALRIMGE